MSLPADTEYLTALGRFIMWFARCEWGAVWCCERLSPGYISTVLHKTAGVIANDLITKVGGLPDAALRSVCQAPITEFKRLVGQRNALLHAKPATEPNGEQRLFGIGGTWTAERVDALSAELIACDLQLNGILHKHLASLAPQPPVG